jgi:hypothetical protein
MMPTHDEIIDALQRGLGCAYSLHCEAASRDQEVIEDVLNRLKREPASVEVKILRGLATKEKQ